MDLVRLATDDGGHRRGANRRGRGHGASTLADEHEGIVVAQRTGEGGRGQLTDAVTGDDIGLLVTQQLTCRRDRRGDQQRLGHRGVANRVGIGRGAKGGQVKLGHLAEVGEARSEAGHLEPGGEESGGLGALTGRDDCKHVSTLSAP